MIEQQSLPPKAGDIYTIIYTVKCPNCNGTGIVGRETDNLGYENDIKCTLCNGTGKVECTLKRKLEIIEAHIVELEKLSLPQDNSLFATQDAVRKAFVIVTDHINKNDKCICKLEKNEIDYKKMMSNLFYKNKSLIVKNTELKNKLIEYEKSNEYFCGLCCFKEQDIHILEKNITKLSETIRKQKEVIDLQKKYIAKLKK